MRQAVLAVPCVGACAVTERVDIGIEGIRLTALTDRAIAQAIERVANIGLAARYAVALADTVAIRIVAPAE